MWMNLKRSIIICPGPQINRGIRNKAQATGFRAHVTSQILCSSFLLLENSPGRQRGNVHNLSAPSTLWYRAAAVTSVSVDLMTLFSASRFIYSQSVRLDGDKVLKPCLPVLISGDRQVNSFAHSHSTEQQCKSIPTFGLLAGYGRRGGRYPKYVHI